MSLHALAGHMSAKGRGPDSMLVHMTPREVASLQALAERNGTSLTINPETGLPEAFKLKDLLPAIAGVALGPAGFGLMSGAMAGLTVGGITSLATGSLSRGLMAGMGAYGASGLAEGLMGAGAGAAQNAAMSGLTQEQIAAQMAEKGLSQQGVLNQAAADATSKYASSGFGDRLAQGASAAMDNPKGFVEGMGGYGKLAQSGLAAISPIMADQGVQTATQRSSTPANIRRYSFDPYSGGYTSQGMYPAEKDKGMAQGGIVALAGGGAPPAMDQNYVNQLIKEAAAQAGGTLSYADASNAAKNLGISPDMLSSAASNTGLITGAPAPVAGPAAGSAAYNSMVGNFFNNPNITAADVSSAMSTYGLNQADVANAARASGVSNAAQYAAFQPDVGVGADKVGGLRGLSSNVLNWMKQYPNATQAELDAAQAHWGYNDADVVRPYENGYQLQAGQESAAQKYLQDNKDVSAWLNSAEGRTYLQQNPQFDAADIALTHFNRYGQAEGRAWGAAPVATTPKTNAPGGTTNPYGNPTNPGDKTFNADGSITIQPNIPGRPYGGFTGMQQVKDAYTQGGGSLGYVNPAPKTMNEFDQRFNKQTGSSLAAYEYLMGKGAYPTNSSTTELMKPYSESALGIAPAAGRPTQKYIYDARTKTYKTNPDFIPVTYDSEGQRVVGVSDNQVLEQLRTLPAKVATGGIVGYADGGTAQESVTEAQQKLNEFLKTNNVSYERIASLLNISVPEAKKRYPMADTTKAAKFDTNQSYGTSDGYGATSGAPGASGVVGDSNSITGGAFAAAMDALGLSQDPSNVGVVSFGETGFGPSAAQGYAAADSVGSEGLGSGSIAGYAAADAVGAEGLGSGNLGGAAAGEGAGAAGGGNADGGAGNSGDGGTGDSGTAVKRGGRITQRYAVGGGLGALARGGQAGYNLGGYSDGGRLLRGPGDGVSDSIPATIGNRQPARLADGEFVIPARIVSELGNGSTEAGARKLYSMMDRVQKARGKTTGKNRVAANTRSDKYLPA